MSELPLRVLQYGRDEPLPEAVTLRAGPLTLLFEEGGLRYVRLGDREVLRRVYVAVRDQHWNTIPFVLSNVEIEPGDDRFRVAFDCEHRQNEIDFFWKGVITGAADGTVAFSMDGVARSTFLRGRIGFCVLHPPEACAGQPFWAEKADGSAEQGVFPREIAPHQPVGDLRAIAHEVAPGVRAEVRFEGDVFEMEDQRNWTDASYKTYCTPLYLPKPVRMEPGTVVQQSVTLSLSGDVGASELVGTGEASLAPTASPTPIAHPARGRAAQAPLLRFDVGRPSATRLPRIGLGLASHGRPLSRRELDRLDALNLDHLRVDLRMAEAGWPATLGRAWDEASALGAVLEVALYLTDAADDELRSLVDVLEEVKPTVGAWLIFHVDEPSTTEPWVRLARAALAGHDAGAKFGAGAQAYFTQLNRGRPPVGALDLVCYSINPQVHAFDNRSLVETLVGQAWTVESARQFVGELPIALTPITLRPRFNASAIGPEAEPGPDKLPWPVDPRQMSLFGAAWTVGSLKYVAESGVYSATYYETSGWRGVIEMEAGSAQPALFRSLLGAVFPLYHVLADIGEFAGGTVAPSTSSDPLRLDGLALRKDDATRVLVANLGPDRQRVTLQNLGRSVRVRSLDETNAERAMRSPEAFRADSGEPRQTTEGRLELELLPYAVVRVDSDVWAPGGSLASEEK